MKVRLNWDYYSSLRYKIELDIFKGYYKKLGVKIPRCKWPIYNIANGDHSVNENMPE